MSGARGDDTRVAPRAREHPRADPTGSDEALNPQRDLDRLADMRDALADIRALTTDGKQTFENDRIAQQAVAYNLAVLGGCPRQQRSSPSATEATPPQQAGSPSPR
jgi:hypothetical protein